MCMVKVCLCVSFSPSYSRIIAIPTIKTFGTLRSELYNGIRDLEEFSDHIKSFSAWWNWMQMEARAHEKVTEQIRFNYNSLHSGSAIKWKEVKTQYAAYADEVWCIRTSLPDLRSYSHLQIGCIEDCYPTLFAHSRKIVVKGDKGRHEPDEEVQKENEKGFRQGQHQCTCSACGPSIVGSALIDKNIPPAGFLSAKFAKADDIGASTSSLVLDFQCHPTGGRRFTFVEITWKFEAVNCASPASPPRVVWAAPLRSIGGQVEEQRRTVLGTRGYVHAVPIGASVGVDVKAELEKHVAVPHAMTITGSIRGDPEDHCVWTVKENGASETGIPPHFRIVVVLEHAGLFLTTLNVEGKVEGGRRWQWWRKHFHCDTERVRVDVGVLKSHLKGYPEARKHVQGVDGTVPGADTHFLSPIVA
jgi:hypothetical protein